MEDGEEIFKRVFVTHETDRIESFDQDYAKEVILDFTYKPSLSLILSPGKSNTEKVSNEDILAASKIKEELEKLSNERESEKFGDNDIDLKYLKKMQQANK